MALIRGRRSRQPHAGLFVPAPGGGASPTWTKTAGPAIQAIAFGSNDATFSSTAVNNSATGDTVVVMVTSSDRAISGVTIGGNAMTKAIDSTVSSGREASIWYRTGNIYTTPNIVVSGGAALAYVGISVGVLTGVTATPADTDALTYGYVDNPATPALTNPSTGFVLAVACSESGSNDPTWANITEDYDLQSTTNWRHTSGFSNSAGSVTPSIPTGWDFAGSAIAAAAWGP